MTPGPTIIRQCSACSKQFREYTIGSGNTFGARFWTDGYMLAPMLPDQPWLVKCPYCGAAIWVDEQKEVERIEWMREPQKEEDIQNVSPASTATQEDYIAILASGLCAKEKEKYLRIRIWWMGNNSRRGPIPVSPITDAETANLKVFASLLDESDDSDRILKAEALRELGMFAEAEKLLAKTFDDQLMAAVTTIRSLAQQRNATVAEIIHENDAKGAIYV